MIHSKMGSSVNAWCAQHMQEMGKIQRDAMTDEDRRTATIKELSDLKGTMEDAKAKGDWGGATKALDDFMAKHADDPDFAAIKESLGGSQAEYDQSLKDYNSAGKVLIFGGAFQEAIGKKADDGLDAVCTKISGLIDALSKANQMGMLDIQEANSQENQVFQTASNIAASKSSAAQTAVGNIRG